LGYIWQQVIDDEPKVDEAKNNETHLVHSNNLYYYYENYNTAVYNLIKNKSKEPLSDETYVFIDRYFFDELKNVFVIEKNDKHFTIESSKGNIKKLFPILREIDIYGFKFITIPSILFINTLLSLLVAVVLQILFHKRKFLLGGEAE
jgi:hypothetical protein